MFLRSSSQPCSDLYVGMFCGNRLVHVVAIVIATWALLHLIANEMEERLLYPSSAPVVKARPMMSHYSDHRSRMKVIRHAGVESRMIILDDQARQ